MTYVQLFYLCDRCNRLNILICEAVAGVYCQTWPARTAPPCVQLK